MEIKIENISLNILSESDNVRVRSDKEDVLLINQNVNTISDLIKHNFSKVYNHYKLMVEKAGRQFDFADITYVSIAIVLQYLYMYNLWRNTYKKQENRDLRFDQRDFNHPSTHDIVFNYFKPKYSLDWEEKCAILLGMGLSELKAYYKTREDFYNK
jgi:hypothetical protein